MSDPLRGLLGRLNDLKRIRTADDPTRSLAQRGFARAWGDLAAGVDPAEVAARESAAAVAAVELAGIDAAVLRRGGLDDRAIWGVFRKAIDQAARPLTLGIQDRLAQAVPQLLEARPTNRPLPPFVRLLQDQPRAGATHPTEARLILEPPESHADHCHLVAVTGFLWAGHEGRDGTEAFVAGLAHHLHNARLPDSGYAGEELLGEHLKPLMDALTAEALTELPPAVAERVRRAFALLPAPDSPEAEAFHAADVIDRVLEVAHYDRVARFRTADALDTLGLVHPGPLKVFQDRVLADLGLWP